MPLDGEDEVTWFPPYTLLKDEVPGGCKLMSKSVWKSTIYVRTMYVAPLRIAVSFAFMSKGELIELDNDMISYNYFEDVELFAAVGNGLN
ncbi:unnamed protein product [Rhizoctonia solani]|uniref:Uncharacterized protein n=1 Tax=Rhizoctonia solani TaxID=456999 RepID=A0A8H3A3A4_9AGAM|nr:unnamed protein product [Rhizoctonia solani]